MKPAQIRTDIQGNRYLVIGQQPDKSWAIYNIASKQITFADGKDMIENTKVSEPSR